MAKVGDKVLCVEPKDDEGLLVKGRVYSVERIYTYRHSLPGGSAEIYVLRGVTNAWDSSRFVPVKKDLKFSRV